MIGALARLRPDDREILTLSAWEELTAAQIAQRFEITVAAAEKRLTRAKARFANVLPGPSTPPRSGRREPMSDVDQAYARLVTANPWPDTLALTDELDAFPVAIEEELMGVQELEQARQPRNRSGWLIGVAAAVAVLAALGIAALLYSQTETAGDPETPVEVIEAFIEAWNDGDVDQALSYIDPTVNEYFAGDSLVDYMAGLVASTYASEFEIAVTNCVEPDTGSGSYSCSWLIGGPVHEAYYTPAAVPTYAGRVVVEGGLITDILLPRYDEARNAATLYVRQIDPEGLVENCIPEEIYWPRRECGEWFAQYVDGYVSSTQN